MQKFQQMETWREVTFKFTKALGEWKFTFTWEDAKGDQHKIPLQRNLPTGWASCNPLRLFWEFILRTYMALIGAKLKAEPDRCWDF